MTTNLPSHVPPELVRDFSVFKNPEMMPTRGGCPYRAMQQLRAEPPVTFIPDPGQSRPSHWLLNRAEDIRTVLQNPTVFSSHACAGFSRLIGESWDMLPLEADPPRHAKYRALLEVEMTPKKMDALTPKIEAFANQLIDQVKGGKDCEFVKSFAQRFPVMVFLSLFGLPTDQLDKFAGWAYGILHGQTLQVQAQAAKEMKEHLQAAMQKAASEPQDTTLLSKIVHGQIDGVALTDDEKIGYAFMIFLGGLDTVASSLGYYFRHLAEHPELQQQLRAQPELIPTAVEEFLRLYSNVTTKRKVTRDTEIAGVQVKEGDWVSFTLFSANSDPSEVDDPETFRLDRGNKPHFTFGAGKHRCMGSHLARIEMAVFLRRFFEEIPTFRLKEGTQPLTHGGGVFGIKEMYLAWD